MNVKDRTVVITGTSTGIGMATALYLDKMGFTVFAGVRKESDGTALERQATGRLKAIRLDVTDDESIAAAAHLVTEATGGKLSGLINNAGVSLNGPLELVPVADIRKVLNVNTVGLLAVTKAFIPLLRSGKGRIVNISSGHGLLGVPDKSVYAASKFAVQAVSDSLRVELRPFGIKVSCLVVGKVDTEVLGKITAEREQMVSSADPEISKLYKPLFVFFDREVRDLPGIKPEEVAGVAARALTDARPRAQYLVGPGAKKMKNLARLPVSLRDGLMYKAIYGSSQ
jgi:NAD(P)-dependent dehydrogenase (short-subunit alcohol dehydrogenase family)